MTAAPGLIVENLEVAYGRGAVALREVSIEVPDGGFVAVLGPNGAGKSTLVRAITGLLPLHRGRILRGRITFRARSLHGAPPHRTVRAGVCQVPEGRKVFPRLTVRENLLVGATSRKDRRAFEADIARILELFPRLEPRQNDHVVWLSGGEQQMVAVGRALLARPKLMILDELSLGLAPQIVHQLFEVMRTVRSEGTGILLIEQNARLALQYAEQAYILESGEVALAGDASKLREDPRVAEFYLGGSASSRSAAADSAQARHPGEEGE